MSDRYSQIPHSFPDSSYLRTKLDWAGNTQHIIVYLENESTYNTAVQVETEETIEQVVIRVLCRIYPIAHEQYRIKHIYNADNWELCKGWSASSHLSKKWTVYIEKLHLDWEIEPEYPQEPEVEKKSCCVLQ